MKSASIAWVFGAVAAIGMGMAAEACSSSSTTDTNPGTDGGHNASSGQSGNSTSAKPTGDGGATTSSSGGSGATGGSPCGGEDSGTSTCEKPPGKLYTVTAAGELYCPFSAVDGGENVKCGVGEQCCVPPESSCLASTCVPLADECPHKDSVDWQCEATIDCASMGANYVCCGQGSIGIQPAQPTCGDGGYPAFPFVHYFYGTHCQTSCDVFTFPAGTDAGPGFQVCSQQSECPADTHCVAIKPKGNSIGYCAPGGPPDAGSSSSSGSTGSTSGASTSGAATSGTSTSSGSKASSSS